MKARDASMTLDEFKIYYDSHRGVISSVKAYEAAGGRWAGVDELFRRAGVFTLIVVKFKNNTFLRIDVKPSLEVRLGPGRYGSAATWKSLGVDLTYEEKEFLATLGDMDLTPGELIEEISASPFEGKDSLARKLKKALETMKK